MSDLIVDLAQRLLDAVGDTLDLLGVFLIDPLGGERGNEFLPVVLTYLEFDPLIGECKVAQYNGGLADIALEPDVNVHYSLSEQAKVNLEAQVQEHDVLQLSGVMPIQVVLIQIVAESSHSIHLPEGVWVAIASEEVV